MEKTIKQLADELQIKKHIVKYKVQKLSGEYVEKRNGIFYINDDGQKLIKDSLGVESKKTSGEYPENNPEKTDNYYSVDILLKELEEKNKQIEVLHDMFKQQQKLLDQQQVLTLQANKKIEQLELQQEEKEDGVEQQIQGLKSELEVNKEEVKKGFWQRLFKG